jgi:hypothetical protein
MATVTVRVTENGVPVEGAQIYTSIDTKERVTDASGEYSDTVPDDYAVAAVVIVKTPTGESGGTHLIEAGETLEFDL